ncbi:hypothetical protein OWR29_25400 [Actinoplanes sp. Pm04-4]|uniref:Uncharacterized protein n=1 Tax=Paractinoplanes pyxinae TaxID=2997416 RepID=A0ABT4B4C2_9ACTN|nr:hypothetical protein [Actinoplanes pyxinae]MCY1141348.1 hypothetical protein [Actinoplanes pyxinae]
MTRFTYRELADSLRKLADQLAPLTDQEVPGLRAANIYLSFPYDTSPAAVERNRPAVDAIAEAMGVAAKTKIEGRGITRRAEYMAETGRDKPIYVNVRCEMPAPPTRAKKLAELQRENDELRAQLASGGAQ